MSILEEMEASWKQSETIGRQAVESMKNRDYSKPVDYSRVKQPGEDELSIFILPGNHEIKFF